MRGSSSHDHVVKILVGEFADALEKVHDLHRVACGIVTEKSTNADELLRASIAYIHTEYINSLSLQLMTRTSIFLRRQSNNILLQPLNPLVLCPPGANILHNAVKHSSGRNMNTN